MSADQAGDPARPSLTDANCKARQARLRARLDELQLDAALICDRRHVYYLTGCWTHQYIPAAVAIMRSGATVLAMPEPADRGAAADRTVTYAGQKLATMVEDRHAAALTALLPALAGVRKLGCDEAPRPGMLRAFELHDLAGVMLDLRRAKDADEVAMIRHALTGVGACYQRVREVLQPDMTELELAGHVHAAAVEAVGELIGEMGNDFQANSIGGPMRDRAMREGELIPLDLSVCVRGYSCDVSRTFAVDRQPTELQLEAHALVLAGLAHVEKVAKAGKSCRELFEEVHQLIDGKQGWRFTHHLGHGIGLCSHEAPRLNPNWNDALQVGDVFTAEPGLYGENLHAGIRIENNYLVTRSGVLRLSDFPTDL